MRHKQSLQYLIVFIFFTFSINVFGQRSIHGIWQEKDNEEVGLIKFEPNGMATFVIGDDTLGGDNFMIDSMPAKLTYVVDYTTSPISLDYIITNLETNEEIGRILGIIQFIEDKKMRIRLDFEDSSRPLNFLPEGNEDTVVLYKTTSL